MWEGLCPPWDFVADAAAAAAAPDADDDKPPGPLLEAAAAAADGDPPLCAVLWYAPGTVLEVVFRMVFVEPDLLLLPVLKPDLREKLKGADG